MGKDKYMRRGQHVQITGSTGHFSMGSDPNSSRRPSRQTFLDSYVISLNQSLERRKLYKVIEGSGSDMQDLTPPLLDDDLIKDKLFDLSMRIRYAESLLVAPSARDLFQQVSTHKFGLPTKSSLEENMSSIMSSQFMLHDFGEEETNYEDDDKNIDHDLPNIRPFIKVVLRKTPEIVLFECRCLTVRRGTEAADQVEEDNKFYDYITMGKGRIRRMNTSEAQTDLVFCKSRETSTWPLRSLTMESYVSNYEMFQTFRDIKNSIISIGIGDTRQLDNNTNTESTVDKNLELFQKYEFKLTLMIMLRLLASNVFEVEQRRFRNMKMPNPMSLNSEDNKIKYDLEFQCRLNPQATDRSRKAVSDLTFCPGNGDIIAVAYGIFSFGAMHVPENGYCCIWNIKNPINPERIYFYKVPVSAVCFNPYMPQLLAIGLYDGSVEVRDISTFIDIPVAISHRTESSTCDPITSMRWIRQANTSNGENSDIEPLLALSQDGSVTKYRIINSPYFVAFQQIKLDRIEGMVEGLAVQRLWNETQSNRHPQGLSMKLHPRQHDLYYVLTDEGCIYKCSTNYPHQHLEVLQVHAGSVNYMDFSPWSPKLFLTAGNDWCVRIWIEGIFEPLITLQNDVGPVHCAAWSKTHSTIIVSDTQNYVNIWDIRRSTLKPMSAIVVDKSHNTLFEFSRCGRSIAIGNERGSVLVMGLEGNMILLSVNFLVFDIFCRKIGIFIQPAFKIIGMPFPPHFQYEELELAIYRAISTNPELTNELKGIGFFGYPEQQHNRQHHCYV